MPEGSSPILDGFGFAPGPLSRQEQLFRYLHGAIISGRIQSQTRLPPSRKIARHIGVSRQTVVIAYERLMAEGLLLGRQGSGYYVAPVAEKLNSKAAPDTAQPQVQLSKRSVITHPEVTRGPKGAMLPLEPGLPDLGAFPHTIWSRLESRYWRQASPEELAYSDSGGVFALREAIAEFVNAFRGVPCTPDQVIVTAGTQSGIFFLAMALAEHGQSALVENPGYPFIQNALTLAGLRIQPVPVDRQGLVTQALPHDPPFPRLLICTPSHHFPLGVGMSLERRADLLDWARNTGCMVVEDDYDSEFRYGGAAVPPLAALDQGEGRVIYAGTLSKLLAPGLRIGFLIVPEGLVDALRRVRSVVDRHVSVPMQYVCAEFIGGGFLAAHIRRMKPLYAERHMALVTRLKERFRGQIEIMGRDQGLHVCALMEDEAAEKSAEEACQILGLGHETLSSCCLPQTSPEYFGLALGFAADRCERIPRYVDQLAESVGLSLENHRGVALQ